MLISVLKRCFVLKYLHIEEQLLHKKSTLLPELTVQFILSQTHHPTITVKQRENKPIQP